MEEKLGEAPSSNEEDEVRWCGSSGVDLRGPPAMLRRRRRCSMVGEMVELLHGLEFEKERGE